MGEGFASEGALAGRGHPAGATLLGRGREAAAEWGPAPPRGPWSWRGNPEPKKPLQRDFLKLGEECKASLGHSPRCYEPSKGNGRWDMRDSPSDTPQSVRHVCFVPPLRGSGGGEFAAWFQGFGWA